MPDDYKARFRQEGAASPAWRLSVSYRSAVFTCSGVSVSAHRRSQTAATDAGALPREHQRKYIV